MPWRIEFMVPSSEHFGLFLLAPHPLPSQIIFVMLICMEADDKEIPEKEAACRICFISLCEGGNTFKMECSCKGDLRVTHETCVLKWFNIKGNKKCDICRQEYHLSIGLTGLIQAIQYILHQNPRGNSFLPSKKPKRTSFGAFVEVNGHRVFNNASCYLLFRIMV
ncbi:hypothetical protein IFM89_018859 [Coptis chinensis]|uniref:RING-CH-type domain-containing protein n=1 Tax=Coptis chinensis TaxID=261450 RepID=A0A835HW48_9MAGN|nr:hypothetical protein IFM89_018859 [Coptis chinensis]